MSMCDNGFLIGIGIWREFMGKWKSSARACGGTLEKSAEKDGGI